MQAINTEAREVMVVCMLQQ